MQLRGEALLLQAAQLLGTNQISRNALASGLSSENLAAEPNANAFRLLKKAKVCLTESMNRWQPLHDPEPERPDQNFHLEGKPYNYRAAETYRILTDLKSGVLTLYPLSNSQEPVTSAQPQSSTPMSDPAAPRVFISYSHDSDDHRARVLGLSERLRADGIETILDRYV